MCWERKRQRGGGRKHVHTRGSEIDAKKVKSRKRQYLLCSRSSQSGMRACWQFPMRCMWNATNKVVSQLNFNFMHSYSLMWSFLYLRLSLFTGSLTWYLYNIPPKKLTGKLCIFIKLKLFDEISQLLLAGYSEYSLLMMLLLFQFCHFQRIPCGN